MTVRPRTRHARRGFWSKPPLNLVVVRSPAVRVTCSIIRRTHAQSSGCICHVSHTLDSIKGFRNNLLDVWISLQGPGAFANSSCHSSELTNLMELVSASWTLSGFSLALGGDLPSGAMTLSLKMLANRLRGVALTLACMCCNAAAEDLHHI